MCLVDGSRGTFYAMQWHHSARPSWINVQSVVKKIGPISPHLCFLILTADQLKWSKFSPELVPPVNEERHPRLV